MFKSSVALAFEIEQIASIHAVLEIQSAGEKLVDKIAEILIHSGGSIGINNSDSSFVRRHSCRGPGSPRRGPD